MVVDLLLTYVGRGNEVSTLEVLELLHLTD
jgi:hypothetical protein